jgi:hypothetical protein
MAGWDDLKQIFIDSGLPELANVIAQLLQDYDPEDTNVIYNELRKTEPYQRRFKGNFDRQAAGKPVLSESEYLYNEKMYEETMKAYQAGGLATRDNFANFISNDVSVAELQKRFTNAYTRVTNAVNSNDKPLVDELRKLYPGITDNEIANSILLGKEGSDYLKNKIDIAEVKAAETETGVKSALGADFLSSQGIDRGRARIGLSKVAEQKTGYEQAAGMFGEKDVQGIQRELEQENLLGQTSKRTKRLASQARGQFTGSSGIAKTSLGRKTQV